MKRPFLLCISLVLSFSLLLYGSCVPVSENSGNWQQSAFPDVSTDDYDMLQSEVIETYHLFMQQNVYTDKDYIYSTNPENTRYPEWYGGAFMDDTFCLCIRILKGYESIIPEIERVLDGRAVNFLVSDASYNTLIRTQTEIGNEYVGYFESTVLSAIQGRVIVRLDSNNVNYMELRRELSTRYDCLEFEEAMYATPYVSIIGGDTLGAPNSLNNNAITAFATLGFSCRYTVPGTSTQKKGILTAGHVAAHASSLYLGIGEAAQSISYTNSVIQYANGEHGDFAFLEINDTNTLTNLVRTSSIVTASVTAVFADQDDYCCGTYVNKYGITTGITHGKLIGTTEKSVLDGNSYVLIKGIWEVYDGTYDMNNPIASPGDSGAPVWQNISGGKYLAGILSSGIGNTTDNDPTKIGRYYYFTPFYQMSNDADMELNTDFFLLQLT